MFSRDLIPFDVDLHTTVDDFYSLDPTPLSSQGCEFTPLGIVKTEMKNSTLVVLLISGQIRRKN